MSIGRARGGLDAAFRPKRALGLAVALLLAFPPAAALGQATIGGVQVRPSPFSPNGDGLADSIAVLFTPGGSGDSVTVQVTPVRESDQMAFPPSLPSTTVPVDVEIESFWNPGAIADGAYRFDIVASDSAGSALVPVAFVADASPPVPSFGDIQPNPFDHGLTVLDSMNPPLEVPISIASDSLSSVSSTLTIREDGTEVALLGTFGGTGDSTFTWNGRKDNNAPAGDRVYEAYLESVDLAQNRASVSRFFTVDAGFPTVDIDQPNPLQTTTLPVTLTGTASDSDRITLMEASTDSGQTFGPVDTMSPSDSLVTWQFTVTDSVPRLFDVVIRAHDAASHRTDEFHVVLFDSIAPSPVSSTVVGRETAKSGEEIEILTAWNLDALQVAADFSDLDSGYDPVATIPPETVTPLANGQYRIEYVLSAANNRPPGTREVVITGSTGFLFASDTLQITLEPRRIGDQLVSVDRNRFDPGTGDAVTIAARFATLAVVVWIYDLSGEQVRFLEGRGSAVWDGRDANGQLVSSGVYFLKVKAGEDEELRKVAVMRRRGP